MHTRWMARPQSIGAALALCSAFAAAGVARADRWLPAAADAALPFTAPIAAVAADGTTVLAMSASGQLHRSTDGGSSWHDAGAGLPARASGAASHAATPSVPALALENGTALAGTATGLYRSSDGGRSFQAVVFDPEKGPVRALLFVARGPGQRAVMAASGGQLFRSVDDGRSFQPAARPITDRTILSLWMLEDRLYAAAAGLADAPSSGRRIYRLESDGQTFTDLHQGSAVVQRGNRVSVLMSNLGVLRQFLSADGGKRFEERSFAPARMNELLSVGTLSFAGTGAGVLCSLDGGQSFTSYDEGLGARDVRHLIVVDRGEGVPRRTLLAFTDESAAPFSRVYALDLKGAEQGGPSPALLSAVGRRDGKAVAALLSQGADPGARDASGTALHAAAASGQAEVAGALVAAGADANAADGEGNPPLLRAVTADSPEVVRALLAHGADPKAVTGRGASALDLAAALGHARVVELLLDGGAEVDALDREGMTALMVAAANGHADVVRALGRHGAKVGKKGDAGHSAIGFALSMGHSESVVALLELGSDANESDRGVPLLVIAAAAGDEISLSSLLSHGADPNSKSSRGESALGIALARKDEVAAKLLRDHGAVSPVGT